MHCSSLSDSPALVLNAPDSRRTAENSDRNFSFDSRRAAHIRSGHCPYALVCVRIRRTAVDPPISFPKFGTEATEDEK